VSVSASDEKAARLAELENLKKGSTVTGFSETQAFAQKAVLSPGKYDAGLLVGKTNVKEKAELLEKMLLALDNRFGKVEPNKTRIKVSQAVTVTEKTIKQEEVMNKTERDSIVSLPSEVERKNFLGFYNDFEICFFLIIQQQWDAADSALSVLEKKHNYKNDKVRTFRVNTLRLMLLNNHGVIESEMDYKKRISLLTSMISLLDSIGIKTFQEYEHEWAYWRLRINYCITALEKILESGFRDSESKKIVIQAITAVQNLRRHTKDQKEIHDTQEIVATAVGVCSILDKDKSMMGTAVKIFEELNLTCLRNDSVEILGMLYVLLGKAALDAKDQNTAQAYFQKGLQLPTHQSFRN
jgi:hypothetical protein